MYIHNSLATDPCAISNVFSKYTYYNNNIVIGLLFNV